MAKKYIKATYELAKNVTDLEAFEQPRDAYLQTLLNWATDNNMSMRFGASEDNTYLCECRATARTNQMCKGYIAELKGMLKAEFPKVKIIYEESGNVLW